MDERIKVYDEKMTKTYNNLLGEFATIRAGRANPNILNHGSGAAYPADPAVGSIHGKGHREGNPDFGYRNQPVERWKSHPACVSRADRGAQKGSCKRS